MERRVFKIEREAKKKEENEKEEEKKIQKNDDDHKTPEGELEKLKEVEKIQISVSLT